MRRYLLFPVLALACVGTAQTVRLQLKFPKGRVDRTTMTMDMKEKMSMPGTAQPMEIKMQSKSTTRSQVISSSPNDRLVKVTYESAHSSTTMNGKPFNLGAGGNSDAALNGQSITLHFDSKGQITHADGYQALLAKSIKGAPAASQQFQKQLFNEKSIKEMWSSAYASYPDRPLHVGESWTSDMSIGQGLGMKIHLRMTLTGIEVRNGHHMARIGIAGTWSMDMSGMAQMPMALKMQTSSVTGTSYFDMDRGWWGGSTMRLTGKGTMAMQAQGKSQSMGLSIDMTMATQISALK
jgi:hypothetical protein